MDQQIGLKTIKDAYINKLLTEGKHEEAEVLSLSKIDSPIFNGYAIHPEDEPNTKEINEILSQISIDILALKYEMQTIALNYRNLMSNLNSQIKSIDENLALEEDRIKDLNIICGNFKEFNSILTLKESDFVGNFSYDSNAFCTKINEDTTSSVSLSVLQVTGNGYEGNSYVLKSVTKPLTFEDIDTVTRNNMIDNDYITYYEYSRITTKQNVKYTQDINLDNEEAECAIILFGDNDKFSSVKINSSQSSLILKDVLISQDSGTTFQTCFGSNPLNLNNKDDMYNNGKYIYGSGLVQFNPTQYLKLVFKSNGVTNERLAYTKVSALNSTKQSKTITEMKDTYRHVIKLNNISAFKKEYDSEATLTTGELIKHPVDSIAIFVNEYTPAYYLDSEKCFQYILNINGNDYEITPININRPGVKVIRYTRYSTADNYVMPLTESIKSAKLTIILKSQEKETSPYISNIKVCLGEAL